MADEIVCAGVRSGGATGVSQEPDIIRLTLPVSRQVDRRVRALAASRGLRLAPMLRIWLTERLDQEEAKRAVEGKAK